MLTRQRTRADPYSGDNTEKETWFVKTRKFITSSAGLLVMSSVVANIINFAFNAYLGRHLNFEDFGTITLVSTFVYLLNLFVNGVGTTLNHTVSYLEGIAPGKGSLFFRHTWLHIFIPSMIGSIVWFASVPFISDFFHMSGYVVIAAFAPAIFFGSLNAYNAGYLQGMWSFGMLAFLALFESVRDSRDHDSRLHECIRILFTCHTYFYLFLVGLVQPLAPPSCTEKFQLPKERPRRKRNFRLIFMQDHS